MLPFILGGLEPLSGAAQDAIFSLKWHNVRGLQLHAELEDRAETASFEWGFLPRPSLYIEGKNPRHFPIPAYRRPAFPSCGNFLSGDEVNGSAALISIAMFAFCLSALRGVFLSAAKEVRSAQHRFARRDAAHGRLEAWSGRRPASTPTRRNSPGSLAAVNRCRKD